MTLIRLLLLFAGAAVLSGVTALDGIQPNDEGNVLQAAARIAEGQVPYRDFWHFYPPGHLYLLGGLWEAFGPSLLTWRVLRVACDAAVSVLVYALARRGGAPQPLALAAWLAAALAMAYPSGPHPFAPTLVFALGALLVFERRPAAAGLLAGLAAAWRFEFAAYLGAGVLLAFLLRPGEWRERLQPAARFAGAGAATALLLLAPVVVASGADPFWDQLVRFPLEDFGPYQGLPFPLDYDGPLNTSSIGGFLSDSAEPILLFYLPLALVVGLVASLGALALRFERARWPQVATAVFALGMGHYLLARTDIFHTTPLAVMVSVLAAWALAGWRRPGIAWVRRLGMAAAAVSAVSLGYLLVEGLDRRVLELRSDYARLRLPVADGARVLAGRRAALERAVHTVEARVPGGAPIYVTTRRTDLVSSGNALFYVLAERQNPTRYDIPQPGVITTAPVQREIVRDLQRARPRVVVRFSDPVTARREPNESGKPTGVKVLARYLQETYRPTKTIGTYVLLERRGSGPRPGRRLSSGRDG